MLFLVLIGGVILIVNLSNSEDYYGSSTYGECQINDDCESGGCGSEICGSKAESPLLSTCEGYDEPTPKMLNYQCACVNQKCQWYK